MLGRMDEQGWTEAQKNRQRTRTMTGEHNTRQTRQDMRTGVIVETKQRTSTSCTVQVCKQRESNQHASQRANKHASGSASQHVSVWMCMCMCAFRLLHACVYVRCVCILAALRCVRVFSYKFGSKYAPPNAQRQPHHPPHMCAALIASL